jgi:integrase
MSQAVDEELIAANPVTGLVKRMNLERDKRSQIEPFTSEEVNQFLNTCAENYAEHYPSFLCAFRPGMRLGEILALQWGDIDWNGKFIEVNRSYKRGHVTLTKTGKMRRVDMSDQLIEKLRGLNLQRKREALQNGHGEIVEFIFHRNGKPMEQNYIRRVFKRILSKAGLRDIRFHDIRHTFASLLLSDGASPVYVKEQLGHSSIQMTVDIYGHQIPSSNREMVNRLDTQQSATPPQSALKKRRNLLRLRLKLYRGAEGETRTPTG